MSTPNPLAACRTPCTPADCSCGTERKKLVPPEPGFSTDKQNHIGGRRHSDDRGDILDPAADAAFDRGFRVGIETAMKMFGGK